MFKDELIIIRHARSYHNIRESDDLNCDITPFGRRQAEIVGKFLANHMCLEGFSFFTSPFLRCLRTASQIKFAILWQTLEEEAQPHFQIHDGLREYINHSGREVVIPKGDYEDADFRSRYNWPDDYPVVGRCYKEEFNEELLNRMHSTFHSLPQKSLVVTHGLPALMLAKIATNPALNTVPVWDHSIDNCSITYIVRGRVVWWGRNLYWEVDSDPFLKKKRSYDECDLLVPGGGRVTEKSN